MGDLISRKAAIKTVHRMYKACDTMDILDLHNLIVAALHDMPPVQPECNVGHWYDIGSLSCRCSECGLKARYESDYCPNCGAKMEGKHG